MLYFFSLIILMSESIKENILKLINNVKEQFTQKNDSNQLKEELIDDILSFVPEDNVLYKLLKENENNTEEQYQIVIKNIDAFDDDYKIILNETMKKIDNIDNLKKQTVEKVKNVVNDDNINKIIAQHKNDINKQLEEIKSIIDKIDSKYNDDIIHLKKLVNTLTFKVDIFYPIAFITFLIFAIIFTFTL